MFFDKETDFNYLTDLNNAKVVSSSSQTKGCSAINTLNEDRKSIWLSEPSLPQFIIYDLEYLNKKPKNYFRYFGFYCWHAYSTNPKSIELYISKENKNFRYLGSYEFKLKPGTQFIELKNYKILENNYFRYLKIVIKETFGGNRTYLNQVYLMDVISDTTSQRIKKKNYIITNERKRTESANFKSNQYRNEFLPEENKYYPKFSGNYEEDFYNYSKTPKELDSYLFEINKKIKNRKSENIYYDSPEDNEDIDYSSNLNFKKFNSKTDLMNENNRISYKISNKYLNKFSDQYEDEYENGNENNNFFKYKNINANSNSEYNSSNNSIIRKNNERIRKIETDLNIEKNKNFEEKFYGFIPTPSNSQYSKNDKVSLEYNQYSSNKNKKNLKKDININDNDDHYKADKFNHKSFKTLSPIKKDDRIKDFSSHDESEYKKLENQIKDMQNQINNMNTDFTSNKCLVSKCYVLNDEEKEFVDSEKISKATKFKEKLIDFPLSDPINTKNNNEEIKKSYEILNKEYSEISNNHKIVDSHNNQKSETEISSQRNKKNFNTYCYDICTNDNFNKIINENDNPMNINAFKETNYKIQTIEEKIFKIENDVSEIKRNFDKMQEGILKFIELANENNSKTNAYKEPIINSKFLTNSNLYENKIYENEISISENKNIKFRNNDSNNLNINNDINYNYINQRTNTQISKISSNEFPQSHLQASHYDQNNFARNINNELNYLQPTESNKLQYQHNYNENSRENKSHTSCGYYQNYNNIDNFRFDNNNINHIDKYIRNEDLKDNNAIYLHNKENQNGKSLNLNENYKRYNRFIDGVHSNEERSNNITSGNELDFESRLMKKLEDRFEAIAFNLENRMLNNFIKPSLNSLENNIKLNMNEMKSKFGNFNLYTDNIKQNELDRSKNHDSSYYKSSLNRQVDGRIDTKITEINKLGEKLYDKLLEKEKKLNELKNDSSSNIKN